MLNELLELTATWDRMSGQRLTEANRLGPGKAGEIRATEAGILKDCAAALRKVIAAAAQPATPEASVRNDFPGVDMGMLAYDIAEAIEHGEYPCLDDVGDSDIEANLPAFLRACVATAAQNEDEDQS